MATYRLSAQLISRSAGRCAPAAAAYRAGERLADPRTGEVFDYRRRRDVLDAAILAPSGSPPWALDRQRLWAEAELAERRNDAQVAREIQLSLPHELPLDRQRQLLHAWVRDELVARGMIADVAIHAAHRGGDERNVHAHVLLTTRTITFEGFAGKDRSWNDRALLAEWRASWEHHLNRALEMAGVAERVDHRSYADRDIDREPEPKQGPMATTMERQGRQSRAGDDRRAARDRNAERDRLRAEQRRIEQDLRGEHRRRARGEERPGVAAPDVASWQRWREQVLSEAYARDMQGSRLARYWRVARIEDGLAFQNVRGRFVDRGAAINARAGNDAEIRGMLDVAAIKGWHELELRGSDEFRARCAEAALARGFAVRDARATSRTSAVRDNTRERDDDEWER